MTFLFVQLFTKEDATEVHESRVPLRAWHSSVWLQRKQDAFELQDFSFALKKLAAIALQHLGNVPPCLAVEKGGCI